MSKSGWCIVIILLAMWCFVCYQVSHLVYEDVTQRAHVHATVVCDRPCKCRHLLNLGTWEWAECMGVGRK